MSAARRRATDEKRDDARDGFARVKRAERAYARGLRAIARNIGMLSRAFTPGDPDQMSTLQRLLRDYGKLLTPWARNHAARMLADVSRRDFGVWKRLSRTMSRALGQEIKAAPTGIRMQALLAEQVTLITSLPIEAAERVHKLTIEGMTDATRASEISKEILAGGEVSKSRADLIARTEVARTASVLIQARAEYVGSQGYIWRTARDVRVRPEHRILEGQFIRWDSPPVAAADGTRAHAGQIYNCRCFPSPVLADYD